jgi:hypothetical protein
LQLSKNTLNGQDSVVDAGGGHWQQLRGLNFLGHDPHNRPNSADISL